MIIKILLIYEKHGTFAYDISTDTLRDRAYLSIFNQRKVERYYTDFTSTPFLDYEKFKNLKDGKLAREFIIWRSDQRYEYERVEELQLEEAGDV
jgi:hypothetical protein